MKNLLVNKKQTNYMSRNSNIKKKFDLKFFLLINVIISSHTPQFFVCFQLLKFTMEHNLVLALADVLIIEQFF